MNGKKVIAFSWWTCGYVIVAATLFMLAGLAACLPGAEGAACRIQSRQLQDALLVALALGYVLLTWMLFFRRR